jgi:catechol 2,3-dioxygenase-like lactoylglutathione lyase family enzyme
MSILTKGWMGPKDTAPGFMRRPIVMREFMVTGPETKQVLFGRKRFTRPGYGTVHPDSPRGVSEFTHNGLVLPLDADMDWFTDVLGLTLVDQHEIGPQAQGGDRPLGLRPGQVVQFTRYTSDSAPAGLLFTFQPRREAPSCADLARPGARGFSFWSFECRDIAGVRDGSQARGYAVSEGSNEFGEPCLGVDAGPLGLWTFLAR